VFITVGRRQTTSPEMRKRWPPVSERYRIMTIECPVQAADDGEINDQSVCEVQTARGWSSRLGTGLYQSVRSTKEQRNNFTKPRFDDQPRQRLTMRCGERREQLVSNATRRQSAYYMYMSRSPTCWRPSDCLSAPIGRRDAGTAARSGPSSARWVAGRSVSIDGDRR